MPRREFDFINWTSFPSSLKLMNEKPERWYYAYSLLRNYSVEPGSKIRVELLGKSENVESVDGLGTYVGLIASPNGEPKSYYRVASFYGTKDWGQICRGNRAFNKRTFSNSTHHRRTRNA